MGTGRQHLRLQAEQPIPEFRHVDDADAVDLRPLHQFADPAHAVHQLVRVAEHEPLVLKGDVGHVPAVAAAHDDLVGGDPHVGEEDLVELGPPGHGAEGPHLDPRRGHGHQQVGQAGVPGAVRLGPAEEHHVRVVGRAGPDLLAVDHEVAVLLHPRVRTEARSLPAPGSEYPWHQITSPRMVGPTQRRRCASVPTSRRVGTSMLIPWFMMPG